MVKTGRKEVGVPLRVVLQPPVDELVVVVAFCAFANAKKEESSVEAWRKLVRAILLQMVAVHVVRTVNAVEAGKDACLLSQHHNGQQQQDIHPVPPPSYAQQADLL